MYSLRKCTVVSCNAACLSWFPLDGLGRRAEEMG